MAQSIQQDNRLHQWIRIFLQCLGALPTRVRDALAVILGRLLFLLDAKHRRIALSNLDRAFGDSLSEKNRRTLARRSFENLFRIVFEIGWLTRQSDEAVCAAVRIVGESHYQAAAAKGRGVLLLLSHFGNWEFLPAVARMTGMTANIVYRTMDVAFLDRFFRESRERFGGRTIPNDRGAMLRIVKALKRGQQVGMLMDQNVDWYEGVFVDFFGHRACTHMGMARVALKTRAPVVPLCMVRRDGGFDAVFGPKLPHVDTGDLQRDLESNTANYNRAIEAYVRQWPDQWFWVHQRWKTRPWSAWPRTES